MPCITLWYKRHRSPGRCDRRYRIFYGGPRCYVHTLEVDKKSCTVSSILPYLCLMYLLPLCMCKRSLLARSEMLWGSIILRLMIPRLINNRTKGGKVTIYYMHTHTLMRLLYLKISVVFYWRSSNVQMLKLHMYLLFPVLGLGLHHHLEF